MPPAPIRPPLCNIWLKRLPPRQLAAVDRHLVHMGLCPPSEPASSQDFVNNARPLVGPASVPTPPPPTGSVAPTTHSAAVSTDNAYPFETPASVATPPPLTGSVAPTIHPVAVSINNAYPVMTPAPVSAPLPPADSVVPTANPAPAPSRITPPPATSFAPALNGPLTPAPPDERILYDDSSSQASNTSSSLGLRADFVANL